ncbi:MAG: hypothetical protein WBB65_15495 [Anaerolineales bacterium]
MLNEVKHLVLRSEGCFLPGTRFFVEEFILRSPRPKGVGSEAERILRMTLSGGIWVVVFS